MAANSPLFIDDTDHLGSFKDFLFAKKKHRTLAWSLLLLIVLQFVVFKYFYPYASYIHGDSFVYLETAYKNLSINTYMIGYSMFLRLLSVFSTSDWLTTFLQYVLLQASALFLIMSVFYFYHPSRATRASFLVFTALNPLFLYMGNMISSDAYFLALSLTWFSLMLWIMHKPSTKIVVWHAIVLLITFTVRYNALIYLFIAGIAFWLSSMPRILKWLGLGAAAMLIGYFVVQTSAKYRKLTGIWQYSPFAGWQLANNALYAYRYVDRAQRMPVLRKFQALDNNIRKYFDSTRDIKKNPTEAVMASTYYMWSSSMPLFNYRNSLFKKDSTASEFKKWATVGPLYKEYGIYIIKKYPFYFIQYYLWPNAIKYYAPPVEFLESFNSGKDSVNTIAKTWFEYESRKVTTRTKDFRITTLDFYPIFSGIVNVVMFFSLLFYFIIDGWNSKTRFRKGILLGGTIWLLNAGFTIAASSAALRFQAFPILVTAIFSGLLVDYLWKMANITTKSKNKYSTKVSLSV